MGRQSVACRFLISTKHHRICQCIENTGNYFWASQSLLLIQIHRESYKHGNQFHYSKHKKL
jgi:hypothetical protein